MLNGTPRIYRTAFASSARDTSAQITRTQLCGTVCRRLSITDEAYRRIMAIFVPYPYGRTRLLFTRGNRSTLILLPSVFPSLPLLFFSLSFSFFLFLCRLVVRSTVKPSSFRNLTHPQPRLLVALTLCTGYSTTRFPRYSRQMDTS